MEVAVLRSRICLTSRRTPGLLGGSLSGEQTKWWQAAQRRNTHGQYLFASDAGRSGLYHLPDEGDNYLAAQYHRIARRRGREKAIVAVSHSLLVIIYHVLREKKPYTDLGADYFDKLDTARIERHHVRRLEQLGYTVTLTPAHAA